MARTSYATPAATLAATLAAAALALAWTCEAAAQTVNTDPAAAAAGTYTLDKAHTSVTMRVSHLGLSYYTLRFDSVSGSYVYEPSHPEATRLDVSIDANSLDTGDPAFNRQIAAQVFDTAKYPAIHFVSTAVRQGGEDHGTLAGELTFHGVTRPVTLDVIYNGAGKGLKQEARMGFSATATIRRSDFGASSYLPAVGDEVSVGIETEFSK